MDGVKEVIVGSKANIHAEAAVADEVAKDECVGASTNQMNASPGDIVKIAVLHGHMVGLHSFYAVSISSESLAAVGELAVPEGDVADLHHHLHTRAASVVDAHIFQQVVCSGGG
mmetsp:Transcript_17777/g.24401  ORF Transcript_17777/g.24401 Transcript_17777/m.24401 type:complete len:114 (-) Transcript_17777:1225-1566(-)